MVQLLSQWLISALAVYFAGWLLPGITVKGLGGAAIVALVLGLLNCVVEPILTLLSLPITILTLGLFLFVIDAAIVLLTARIVKDFEVDGFWWALLFALIVSVASSVLNRLFA